MASIVLVGARVKPGCLKPAVSEQAAMPGGVMVLLASVEGLWGSGFLNEAHRSPALEVSARALRRGPVCRLPMTCWRGG